MEDSWELLRPWLTPLSITVGAVALLTLIHLFLHKRQDRSRFTGQVVLLALTFLALVAVLVALPVSESLRGQLLSLLGILVSAAIALSATTFVGNAMAGLMLRALQNFRPGDFIRVGEHHGRVSERGLFHTEIQTEDSDLTTLPNLHLVTNPVTVVRSGGTIVSSTVSLGYDVARGEVQAALLEAAAAAGLEEAFVQITELGDFSITYRVAGLLREVKTLLSARSRIREATLDALHGAGIEIVSPNFMNTRSLPEGTRILPKSEPVSPPSPEPSSSPEQIVFEKAEEAESVERLRKLLEDGKAELQELKARIKDVDEARRAELEAQRDQLEARTTHLEELLLQREQPRQDPPER